MTLSPHKIYLGELNHTPLGNLRLAISSVGLVALEWADSQPQLDSYLLRLKRPVERNQKIIQPYAKEVGEYLKGKRHDFTFPIDWSTLRPFQLKTLKAVFGIPYENFPIRQYLNQTMLFEHPWTTLNMIPKPRILT